MYVCVCIYMHEKENERERGGESGKERERERGAGLETNRESDEKGEGVPLVKHQEFFTEVIGLQWKG